MRLQWQWPVLRGCVDVDSARGAHDGGGDRSVAVALTTQCAYCIEVHTKKGRALRGCDPGGNWRRPPGSRRHCVRAAAMRTASWP
ncbi:hypothetical protein ABT173_36620 [Streptomyces sp. NPDC001795]|uniref:hypothetical protein n=1 Tax=Streptomyces sp. NPDC001795 TaxID=3154525 RepID=UPI00332EE97B